MNADDTANVLRIRRDLTGESFNDGTVTGWTLALKDWAKVEVRDAVIAASRKHERVTVAHVVELLDPLPNKPKVEQHDASCMCAGRGWIEVEQHDDHGSWMAWDRCPDGPRTGFFEVD